MLDKPPPDVPGGIIVGVQFLFALLTLELVTSTVVLVGESALAVTTPLTRVLRLHVVDKDTVFLGLVRNVVLQLVERLLLELLSVRDAFSNLLEILNGNRITVVPSGFQHDRKRHTVKVILAPVTEPVAHTLDGAVG